MRGTREAEDASIASKPLPRAAASCLEEPRPGSTWQIFFFCCVSQPASGLGAAQGEDRVGAREGVGFQLSKIYTSDVSWPTTLTSPPTKPACAAGSDPADPGASTVAAHVAAAAAVRVKTPILPLLTVTRSEVLRVAGRWRNWNASGEGVCESSLKKKKKFCC